MRRIFSQLFTIAATTALLASNAGAAMSPPFSVLSEGGTTCGEYIAQPWMQTVRMEWVVGYITGRNFGAPPGERLAGSSLDQTDAVVGWLQSYCAAHALDHMVVAAEALRKDYLAHEGRRY